MELTKTLKVIWNLKLDSRKSAKFENGYLIDKPKVLTPITNKYNKSHFTVSPNSSSKTHEVKHLRTNSTVINDKKLNKS